MIATGQAFKILQLLASGQRLCGVDMIENDITISRAGIYVVLDRMETEGLISGDFEPRKGVRGRGVKVYEITADGALKLRRTLAALAVTR